MQIHHIGIVVESIENRIPYYVDLFGMWVCQPKIYDPLQKVNVAFLQGDSPAVLVELIEPAASDSPVSRTLKRGGGLEHLCYLVPCLEDSISNFTRSGALLVRPPLPAAAFQGRRVAFLYTPLRELIELLEEAKEYPSPLVPLSSNTRALASGISQPSR
jgi:methylmalonyl-CoA/ethylmalonyl-CoA epimerase